MSPWAPEPLWRDAAALESYLADEKLRLGSRLEVENLSTTVAILRIRTLFGFGPIRTLVAIASGGRVSVTRSVVHR